MEMTYFLPNGIKTKTPDPKVFYFTELDNQIAFDGDHIFYDIDFECVSLHDLFRVKIFPDQDEYYSFFPQSPVWLTDAGHNSDLSLSAVEFEKLVNQITDQRYYKILFLADCQALVHFLQSRIGDSGAKFVRFYKELSLVDAIRLPLNTGEDNVLQLSGGQTAIVISLIS
jgi:hypothetical protein